MKLITHSDALAGNVTPGDAAGYPVTISRGGSYRLASNLRVPNGNTHGVQITTNDVTLDLSGFAIQGSGIVVTGVADACVVSNNTIFNNFGSGIIALGTSCVVTNNAVSANVGIGISLYTLF